MTWEVTWALIVGFALSAVVQAVVRRSTVVRLLGEDRPRTLALSAGLGAASSSCSYAAVSLARSLFRKFRPAAWVPDDFWRAFFLEEHPLAAKLIGRLIGPLVAVATFVCSSGNVPNGGISSGGVIAFIFADLLICRS